MINLKRKKKTESKSKKKKNLIYNCHSNYYKFMKVTDVEYICRELIYINK